MPRVAVNGVSLHYEEAGSGPPLLLIHAFPVGRGATDDGRGRKAQTGSVGPEVIAMTRAPVGLVTVWTQPGGRRA
jgi:pimeloyl-ACP methyl ester carboxylesterase